MSGTHCKMTMSNLCHHKHDRTSTTGMLEFSKQTAKGEWIKQRGAFNSHLGMTLTTVAMLQRETNKIPKQVEPTDTPSATSIRSSAEARRCSRLSRRRSARSASRAAPRTDINPKDFTFTVHAVCPIIIRILRGSIYYVVFVDLFVYIYICL